MRGGVDVRQVVRGTGEVLVTAGVLVLLFVAYQLWFTGLYSADQQSDLRADLQQRWSAPAPAPAPAAPADRATPPEAAPVSVAEVPLGEGIAVLRIPRLGPDWAPVVVEGTDREDLKRGPGRIVGTALPGEVGNSVVSGHRTTYGAEFNRFDELQAGDAVVVETADAWLTYEVTGSEVVLPSAVEVTLPVPHRPGVTPTEATMTFTTCHPELSARERLVVYSRLARTAPKADGPPAVLATPVLAG